MRARKFGVLFLLSLLVANLAFATLALADAPPHITNLSVGSPPTADSLVIGVPFKDVAGKTNPGMIQVIYGYASSGLIHSSSVYFGQTSSTGAIEDDDNLGKAIAVADFNRDGYYDIAVGVPGEGDATDSNIGAVNIFYGSETDFAIQSYIGYDAFGADGDQFGAALTTGDFNGDNIPDLAVGVPGYDYPLGESGVYTDAGAVYIFWGKLDNSGLMTSTTDVYYDNDSYGQYGAALAAADFNGDGHDELVIGAPSHSTSASIANPTRGGTFYILTPSNNNRTEWNQTSASGDSAEEGDQFGASFAVGDFNGDGHPDLAIGAPGEDLGGNPFSMVDVGAVSVMYNDGSGLSADNALFLWQSDVNAGWNPHNASEAFDEFGYALASGDFDNDGFDDLAIGTPYENLTINSTDYNNIGMAQLTPGSTTGITPTYRSIDLGPLNPDNNQRRGFSLASGDFDKDGKADIAVGLPGYTDSGHSHAGAIRYCFEISLMEGSSTTCSHPMAQYAPATSDDYDEMGWALASLPAPLSHKIYLPLILR